MVNNERRHSQDDAADRAPRHKETMTNAGPGAAKARGDPDHASAKGKRQPAYETWTREKLYVYARNLGIKRRSSMNKQQLIDALRDH
jgi:hypothetical protein